MGWRKTSVEGRVMWERDGMRVDSTQAIEAIEKAESDALRQSMERTRQMREVWDLEKENSSEEDGNPFAPLIVFAIVILIYLISFFVGN